MGLLPVGLVLGKMLVDNVARRSGPTQIMRSSASLGIAHSVRSRKHTSSGLRGNPFERKQMLQRIGGTSIRRTHTQIERDNKLLQESLMNESWIAVYRYPGIRIAVLLARAKLLQTVASVLFLPYSSYQYAVGHVDITWFYSTAALAVFAPIALLVFSRYLNRLIGVIAMNESNDFVRVGYLTFWGSRRNKFLEVTDVLPLTEVSGSKNDSLIKFSWFGGNNFLYLPTKNVELLDVKRAELLFGDLSVFKVSKEILSIHIVNSSITIYIKFTTFSSELDKVLRMKCYREQFGTYQSENVKHSYYPTKQTFHSSTFILFRAFSFYQTLGCKGFFFFAVTLANTVANPIIYCREHNIETLCTLPLNQSSPD